MRLLPRQAHSALFLIKVNHPLDVKKNLNKLYVKWFLKIINLKIYMYNIFFQILPLIIFHFFELKKIQIKQSFH